MKLRQLRYFVTAVDEGSFSRAARVHRVAQPALSQQIKNLEETLSVVLLDRSPMGVTPTPAGNALVDHARHMFDSLERARQDVIATGHELRGEVSLAIPRMISTHISPILLRSVSENHPQLKLRIVEGTTLNCRELVESARVDVGILDAGQASSRVQSVQLFNQDVFLVGAVDNQHGIASDESPIDFEEAVKYPLAVIEKPHSLRVEIENLALKHGLALNIYVEGISASVNRHCVTGGVAFSFLPKLSFQEAQKAGGLFARRVKNPTIGRGYDLGWPAARKMNAAAQVVADSIIEICSSQFSSSNSNRAQLILSTIFTNKDANCSYSA